MGRHSWSLGRTIKRPCQTLKSALTVKSTQSFFIYYLLLTPNRGYLCIGFLKNYFNKNIILPLLVCGKASYPASSWDEAVASTFVVSFWTCLELRLPRKRRNELWKNLAILLVLVSNEEWVCYVKTRNAVTAIRYFQTIDPIIYWKWCDFNYYLCSR